ncbi:RibD family protein [Leptothermofonsia sichuanensis E412]|nr:RibD family protein [Leptothermofonsia sichuanensis]QZZ23730.1 RibD family protein [Leptothermofonsia sichuanensis E412]
MGDRPLTTVILAMSADGKIADRTRAAARFGSPWDKAHLEQQIAQVDGVLFGAGTLRAYGTTMRVMQPNLLQQRQQQSKPQQPVQILCSQSGKIDPDYPFFCQPVPRWLLTTRLGSDRCQPATQFERILVAETPTGEIDWVTAFQQLTDLGLKHLAILGGGELVASLLAEGLVDEFWFTVCPLILGGAEAPTAVEGAGFLQTTAPQLQLMEVKTVEQEVYLHYRVKR